MVYDIVNVQITHPSFSWNNGLFAVISRDESQGVFNLCKIGENFEPDVFDDNRPMITCTGLGNKEVYTTSVKLEYNFKT